MAEEIKGLKKLRNAGATRKAEWGNPNRKAQMRLDARLADFQKGGDKSAGDHLMHRPGSMKCK